MLSPLLFRLSRILFFLFGVSCRSFACNGHAQHHTKCTALLNSCCRVGFSLHALYAPRAAHFGGLVTGILVGWALFHKPLDASRMLREPLRVKLARLQGKSEIDVLYIQKWSLPQNPGEALLYEFSLTFRSNIIIGKLLYTSTWKGTMNVVNRQIIEWLQQIETWVWCRPPPPDFCPVPP